jgi:hypothetical protein
MEGPYFARHFVRRLPAEEIADAISQATGTFPSIAISDSNVKVDYVMQARSSEELSGKELEPVGLLLASFGQADRDKTERDLSGSTVQAAEPLNSKFIKDHVKIHENGRPYKLLNHNPPLSNRLDRRGDVSGHCRSPAACAGSGYSPSRRSRNGITEVRRL